MPSSYTTSLRLVLPVTGELQNTWGDVVNNGLTQLVEAAIAGTATVNIPNANVTLTTANEAPDQARQMFVRLTGALTAQRDVVCPAVSKLYFVINDTTGGFGINFRTPAGTGVVVPAGQRMVLYCDGTNVVNAITRLVGDVQGTATNITGIAAVANGGTGASTPAEARVNLAVETSSTGSTRVAAGTQAQRDASPSAGFFRFNTSLGKFEGFNGAQWSGIGGGATGGGADEVFVENNQSVTTSYTLPAGRNASSTGPITIADGVSVTISDGSRWVIL